MRPLLSTTLILMSLVVNSTSANAAPKKPTVATLAGTYTCLSSSFMDSKSTSVDMVVTVSKNGSVTGTGTVEETVPNCDIIEQGTCTSSRPISFKLAKLTAPKKKSIYHQSTLKKTTVDAASGFTLSGVVRTFAGPSSRFREISGLASLGKASGSLATMWSCLAPETTK